MKNKIKYIFKKMSDVAPIYTHAVPVSGETHGTVWPWVIVIIILIIVIIILAIWLAVRHTSNDNSNTKTFNLPGAKITAGRTSIQGAWTSLENENDVVTLCVSTDPLIFSSDGTVTRNTNVICDSKDSATKEGGTVEVTGLSPGTIYNAAMTVKSSDATNYRIYGPKRVFTQIQSDLSNVTFNIRDLNSCTGTVSNTGTYTTNPLLEGNYRFGKIDGDPSHNSFIIKHEDGDDYNTATSLILCKKNDSLDVVLAEWEGEGNIHLQSPNENIKIANVSQCLWGYNSSPPDGAMGENRWCLSSAQKVNNNNQTITENLCLARSGTSSLGLESINTSGVTGSDMWINQLFPRENN